MSSALQATFRFQASKAGSEALASLASFYDKLKGHNWHYTIALNSSVYRDGEDSEAILQRIADDSGPVYQWLCGEFRKHMFTSNTWNTPQHPMPPRPIELTLTEAIDIRVDMAKAELTMMALGAIKPLVPASVAKLDPVWPILQKLLYLGAYAGKSKPPALIASHPKLAGAWEQGQQLVADQSHPTI